METAKERKGGLELRVFSKEWKKHQKAMAFETGSEGCTGTSRVQVNRSAC